MTYSNLAYVNDLGGIQALRSDGVHVYLAPGDALHVAAEAGTYGAIAALPAPDPAEALAQARAAVIAERDRRMRLIAGDYTTTERETWHVQAEEAKAYKADAMAPTPLLTPLAAGRGITVDAMAGRVLGLNAAFAAATGTVMAAATVLLAMNPIPADFTNDSYWSAA